MSFRWFTTTSPKGELLPAKKELKKAVRGLMKRGVLFQRYDGMSQDELGIWSSPSGARVAWFTDPDSNTLSLTALPRPAKKNVRRKRSA